MADISRADAEAAHVLEQAMYATAKASECSVCMRQMTVRIMDGKLALACPADRSHEGYRKRRSLTQLVKDGDAINPFVSERIERQRQERREKKLAGNERALALVGERGVITREAAMEAIRALWPKAGSAAVTRALMICTSHNLNPVDEEIYIITYKHKNKDGSYTPVDQVVLGIPGVRKIARERSPYSYADGPRAMLPAEQEQVLGEVFKDKVVATVTLETPKGGRFPGYGFWPRDVEVVGADKGNTKLNMAFYRAERNALKRIVPDQDLPAPVGMVVQGVYAPDEEGPAMLPAAEIVDVETGEVLDMHRASDAIEPEPDDPEARQAEVEAILDIRDKAEISSAQFEKAMRARPEFKGITDPWKLSPSQRRVLRELIEGAAAARARTAEAKAEAG